MMKDERRIIVLISFPSKNFRSTESLKLLNLPKYKYLRNIKKRGNLFELDAWLGNKDKVKAQTNDDYYLTINKKDVRNLSVSLVYDGPISPNF